MKTKEKTTRTLCNTCGPNINHHILFRNEGSSEKFSEKDEINLIDRDDHLLVKCCGCEKVSFLRRNYTLEADGITVLQSLDWNYPEKPYDFYNFLSYDDEYELPSAINSLYNEVKSAFNDDSEILAGLGLRTLVEAICIHQKIVGNNLQDKIQNLHHVGSISKKDASYIDNLRQIGNSSAHEISSLSMDKLQIALEIINQILRTIYVIPKHDKKLKATIAKRNRKIINTNNS